MFEERLTELKEKLLLQASQVEEMVSKSIKALLERDESIITEILERDEIRVNEREVEIEDLALTILARYQPEASYLRTIMAVIKINNDLERIGDHAVNIAEHAMYLLPRPMVKPLIDLPRMAEIAGVMLKESLDAFSQGDENLAIRVCRKDEVVDGLYDQIVRELLTYMIGDPSTIERALKLILVARDLERIADLATNIAEESVYTVTGDIIRHHRSDK
ncbi:phosphate transport system regulatory protein PhoU [candidate division WOR-3 bacterium]|uniref:Phosphate-specific transport system accessory protein PhoU n=1 Tax=candidate division WOR-3 bacterium TaxID=2052148 RepID=A0A660SJ73_UNCW3|nr:MAG: phosphate transport system regulatory protein PhoU [candidate division WOR-3 bacterium]